MLFATCQQELHHLDGTLADDRTGAEDGGDAGIEKELIVLRRDDTTGDNHDVLAAQLLELFDDLRKQGLVTCGQRAGTEDVHVVLDGLLGGLGGSLEQRTHVDIEAEVGIAGGDDLGAAVVTVLSHLGNHDTGATTLEFGELVGESLCFLETLAIFGLTAVHVADKIDFCFVTAEHFLQSIADLAQRGALAGGVDAEVEQVALASAGALGEAVQCCLDGGTVTLGTQLGQTLDLGLAHGGVVDLEGLDGILVVEAVLVDAYDGVDVGVDTALLAGTGLLDAHLGHAALDGLGHAAQLLHFLDVGPGAVGELVGEGLDIVAVRVST